SGLRSSAAPSAPATRRRAGSGCWQSSPPAWRARPLRARVRRGGPTSRRPQSAGPDVPVSSTSRGSAALSTAWTTGSGPDGPAAQQGVGHDTADEELLADGGEDREEDEGQDQGQHSVLVAQQPGRDRRPGPASATL